MAYDLNNLIKSTTIAPPKVIVYGKHGIGKTTIADQAKAVLIDCENGAGHIPGLVRTEYLETWPAMKEVLEALVVAEQIPPAIAIDTVDWMIRRIEEYVCIDLDNKKPGDVTNTLGTAHEGFFKARGIVCNIITRELFPMLNKISQRGCVVILLAHAANLKMTTPEGQEIRMAAPDFPEKEVLPLFMEWADAVLYACKEHGSENRTVITTGDNLIEAKNRYNMPARLPLDWHQIVMAMAPKTEGTK